MKDNMKKSSLTDDKNTGSTEVQIKLLSEKIKKLSEHFKKFKNDRHSAQGLLKYVNRRKRLLVYLKKSNQDSYNLVIDKFNLRK